MASPKAMYMCNIIMHMYVYIHKYPTHLLSDYIDHDLEVGPHIVKPTVADWNNLNGCVCIHVCVYEDE